MKQKNKEHDDFLNDTEAKADTVTS
jgi:hypothetical protein